VTEHDSKHFGCGECAFGTREFDENWNNLSCNYTSFSCILETTKPNFSLLGFFFFFELWFAYNSCKYPKEINSI
jgi:hypothetical protein